MRILKFRHAGDRRACSEIGRKGEAKWRGRNLAKSPVALWTDPTAGAPWPLCSEARRGSQAPPHLSCVGLHASGCMDAILSQQVQFIIRNSNCGPPSSGKQPQKPTAQRTQVQPAERSMSTCTYRSWRYCTGHACLHPQKGLPEHSWPDWYQANAWLMNRFFQGKTNLPFLPCELLRGRSLIVEFPPQFSTLS